MRYCERLTVPGLWWLIGMFFAVSFVTAVGFYLGPVIALAAGLVTAAAVSAVLLWFGRTRVGVDADGLHAGGALLEWPYLGQVRALTAAETARRLGSEADHAAWLLMRPYIRAAVEVEVVDAADPHPYWLISSRNPQALAAALAEQRAISADGASTARG